LLCYVRYSMVRNVCLCGKVFCCPGLRFQAQRVVQPKLQALNNWLTHAVVNYVFALHRPFTPHKFIRISSSIKEIFIISYIINVKSSSLFHFPVPVPKVPFYTMNVSYRTGSNFTGTVRVTQKCITVPSQQLAQHVPRLPPLQELWSQGRTQGGCTGCTCIPPPLPVHPPRPCASPPSLKGWL
jgi:hypothetical protein